MIFKREYRWIINESWGESLHETVEKEPQKFMYLAELEKLNNWLGQTKEELKETTSPKDKELLNEQIKDYEQEIKALEEFVINYERLQERFKFDRNMLKQVQQDWEDYNFQLFSDWNHLQAMIIGGTDNEAPIEERKLNAKAKEAKKKEIQLRFKKLLI